MKSNTPRNRHHQPASPRSLLMPLVCWLVISDVLSLLYGITGLTTYFGLLDVGKAKAGDFVVV